MKKKFAPKRRDFYMGVYAALKHQSTNENQNKKFFYKTLQELRQKTNEVRKKYPLRKNTLHHPTGVRIYSKSHFKSVTFASHVFRSMLKQCSSDSHGAGIVEKSACKILWKLI